MEELQVILSSLEMVGEGAKEAFFWWLVFDKGFPSLLWLVFIVGGFALGFVWARAFSLNIRRLESKDLYREFYEKFCNETSSVDRPYALRNKEELKDAKDALIKLKQG